MAITTVSVGNSEDPTTGIPGAKRIGTKTRKSAFDPGMMDLNDSIPKVGSAMKEAIERRAHEKLAGLADTLRNAFDYVTGQNGELPAPVYAGGGALLGAGAMSGLKGPGMLAGGLLGGALGYGTANAVNQQGAAQNVNDQMLAGGMNAAFGMSNQVNDAQTQALMQQNDMINGIIGSMYGQPQMGGQDPFAGQDPYGGQDMSMASASPSDTRSPGPQLNGLGKKKQDKKASANDEYIEFIMSKL